MLHEGSRSPARAASFRWASRRSCREWVRFGQFFLISLLGFVIDTGLLNALVLGAHLDSALESVGAKAFSASSAGLLNFVMHRRWTYHDRPGSFWRELGRYALVRSSAVALSLFLFGWFRYGFYKLLADHLDPGPARVWAANLAQVAASMLVLLFSYALHGHFTFAPPGQRAQRRRARKERAHRPSVRGDS